jgi:hypothetical protein
MFIGRKPDPVRGMPWELQTFACIRCSAVTQRQPGDDAPASMPRSFDRLVPAPAAWAGEYGSYTAMLDGQAHRIVAYPRGSPLAGKFGCYCDGRYTGLTADLAAAKAWCRAWAERTGVSLDAAGSTPPPLT